MEQYLLLNTLCVFIGFIIDCIVGDPEWLFHPVRFIGKFINILEKFLLKENNSVNKKLIKGFILVVCVLSATFFISFVLLSITYSVNIFLGIIIQSIMCAQCLAARNLKDEAMSVHNALSHNDIVLAKKRLSRIVGRDTDVLNEEGIVKACVETVAENTTDGVIAPLFYLFLGGAIAGMIYKAISTMDSMIAYKNEKYLYFGRVAAILDDVVAFIPSRLASIFMILASFLLGFYTKNAFVVFIRDRKKHESPNAAHTESVCAGALGIQLGGDAVYAGRIEHHSILGNNLKQIEISDIKKACKLMYVTSIICLIFFILLILGVYFAIKRNFLCC